MGELDRYLAKPQLKVTKANYNAFAILAWWQIQKDEYPILSLLAHDVLAMQVSIVASESAFSASGCVIDPYRSCLDPDMVEALVCTKDWITAARRGENFYLMLLPCISSYYILTHVVLFLSFLGSKNILSLPGDLEILEAIKNSLTLEVPSSLYLVYDVLAATCDTYIYCVRFLLVMCFSEFYYLLALLY
jgi:hypothetical protein